MIREVNSKEGKSTAPVKWTQKKRQLNVDFKLLIYSNAIRSVIETS